MNLLQLSWKNLINKPLSTTLSLTLFALGVGLIALLFLLNKQLEEKFQKNQAGVNMVIGAKGSPLQLVLSSMYHVDYPTGNVSIQEVKPFLNPRHPLIETAIPLSLGDSYRGYRIVGTTPAIFELYQAEIAEGNGWDHTFEVVLGANAARELGLQLGDSFQSSHGFVMDDQLVHDDAEAFQVIGVLAPTGSVIDQLILTSPQSVWAVHDHSEETASDSTHTEHAHEHEHVHTDEVPLTEYTDQEITSLLIKFKSTNIQTLNMLRSINENTDMMAANPAYELDKLNNNIGVGIDALKVLAWIIVVVSGLSIFISLYSSLRDRRYELALMRVMGSSPGKLFFLILMEGLLLAVLGYLLGIALAHIGMEVLGRFMKDAYRYNFTGSVFLQKELYLLFGALAVGFLAALLPALQARRTDISTTLAEG